MSNKLSEELQSILDEVNSMHGGDALMTLEGTAGLWPIDKRMPTGSIQLDMAIGIGGWGRGRIHMVAGEESSGKTTLALMTAAAAQARGENVVYIDAESALNPDWANKIGADLERMLISQPSSLESAIDISVTVMNTNKVGLLIIDSIPALRSQEVMEADAEKETRALEARRWSAQMPRIVKAAKDSNTTVIMINQVRDSMSMYGPSESLPGGRTLKFAASTIVKLKKYLEGRNQEEGIDYHDANFDIIKNKQGSPFKKGSYTIWTQSDTPNDFRRDVFYAAIKYGIIVEDQRFDEDDEEFVKKKGWFTLLTPSDELVNLIKEHHDENYDAPGLSAYRQGKMLEIFMSIPGIADLVADQILETLNRDAISTVESDSESEIDVELNEDENESEEDSE